MKKISGYVLVKETGAGVHNLVVAAYDCETPPNLERRSLNSARDLGRRIGSVLTDAAGEFLLSSADLEFQGNESRPDLTLAVFAPEDVLGVEQPYPLPPEQRLLYVSSIPRTEAGAEEAYVVRLLQSQLDKFHIYTADAGGNAAETNSALINAIEGSWRFQDDLRAKLKPRLEAEHAQAQKYKKAAHEKLLHLSAIPRHLRDDKGTNAFSNNRLLISDPKYLAQKLKPLQQTSIKDGLERLSVNRPRLRLRMTAEAFSDLGLTDANGAVDSEKLAAHVRSLMSGTDLVRMRSFNNPSPDELERKYLSEE